MEPVKNPNLTEIILVESMGSVGWIIMRDGLCIVSNKAMGIIKNSKEVQTNHD